MENKDIRSNAAELNEETLENVSGGLLKPIILGSVNTDKAMELNEDMLKNVSGGAFEDLVTCPVCGKAMWDGFICTACDMEDGSVMCHQCGAQITPGNPCPTCGKTWDTWVQEPQWLRG